MDKVSPIVQLDYGPPGTWFKRPRLWRLTIGLSITAGTAAITWIPGLPGWHAAPPDMDLGLSLLEWARFNADGLQIRWSYVPHLWDTRVTIADGSLAPGERITQEEIANQLHVFRSPVLQALRLLKKDGQVGCWAQNPALGLSPVDKREMLKVWLPLHPGAVELVSNRKSTTAQAT